MLPKDVHSKVDKCLLGQGVFSSLFFPIGVPP